MGAIRYSKAWPMISAQSSGSMPSAMVVEPFTSEKRTVTTRRSPCIVRPVRAAYSFSAYSWGIGMRGRLIATGRSGAEAAAQRARWSEQGLVLVAPDPILPWFKGLDQGVLGRFVVLEHVLILGH